MKKELRVTLQAVTPLLLAGAEPQSPELRPPSFRGAFRYWLRAALGGVIGDGDIDGLQKIESAVFGSTECASPISLKTYCTSNKLNFQDTTILPHIERKAVGSRKAFKAGENFDLSMFTGKDNDRIWNAACSALRLALTFGGIGLRSRRGYGTLCICESSDRELVPTFPESFCGWEKYVKETVEFAVKSVKCLCESAGKNILPDPPNGPTKYPCANKMSLIQLCDLKAKTAMDAVKQFMKNVPKDPAFGGIRSRQASRQASPLWVRPIKTNKDEYGLLFCVLASSFKGANYDKISNFLNEKFQGKVVKVKGWNS
ncbi:MAG: type III-B CRISPR module RAMP protein Cmr1 [Armatimonadota bacterium]|nr:type III-B CRISPR module RAMP protein Cmr1 [Armatimonadota bacterium]